MGMVKMITASAVTLLFSSLGICQTTFVARCGEPVGTRYDSNGGQVISKADGFTGVNPIFVVTGETPDKIRFVWGPAQWARDELKLKAHMQEATIISSTPRKITAIRVEAGGVTQMYSLYPDDGLVYFTQHRYITLTEPGVPTTSTFYSKCDFVR